MSGIKKGDLVRYVGRAKGLPGNSGWIGTAIESQPFGGRPAWIVSPDLPSPTRSPGWVYADALVPLRDQPGNEQWIAELRSKLPRTKDSPAVISERGELQT